MESSGDWSLGLFVDDSLNMSSSSSCFVFFGVQSLPLAYCGDGVWCSCFGASMVE